MPLAVVDTHPSSLRPIVQMVVEYVRRVGNLPFPSTGCTPPSKEALANSNFVLLEPELETKLILRETLKVDRHKVVTAIKRSHVATEPNYRVSSPVVEIDVERKIRPISAVLAIFGKSGPVQRTQDTIGCTSRIYSRLW